MIEEDKSMKRMMAYMAAAGIALVAAGAPHRERGVTLQDEAVAVAFDEGLTQSRYLSVYGDGAEAMLEAAFEARAAFFQEDKEFVKHVSRGDIRNVPCIEPSPSLAKGLPSYLAFAARNKTVLYIPDRAVPVSGAMFGVPNAFDSLVAALRNRIGKDIIITGNGKSTYREKYDPEGTSYTFWPLGCAIHERGGYAEEAAHFFDFADPRAAPAAYRGPWSSQDFQRVTVWGELIAAMRGVKVFAYGADFNLNGDEIEGVSRFAAFFDANRGLIQKWRSGEVECAIAQNALILLLAYEEAEGNEDKSTDNAAFRRLRTLLRDKGIWKMVI